MELNNDFFTLEKSRDGRSWSEIGKVPESGTSTTCLPNTHMKIISHGMASIIGCLKQTLIVP